MSQKTNCGIYQIRNLANDKIYIGKSERITKREKKWSEDLMKKNTRYNKHLISSYHKYGAENFSFNILIENLLPEQLNEYEIAMIKFTGCHEPEIGYNKTMGGDGGVPTEEIRKKRSESMQGDNHFTKKMTPEEYDAWLKKKSDAIKGDNHYTKKMTPEELEEWSRNKSEANSGENNWIAKLSPEEYDEECKRRSERQMGENNWINKMEPEEREEYLRKKSEAMIENHPFKKMSPKEYEMYLRKQSENNTGENNWIAKLSPEEYDEECKRRSERMTGENNWINKLTPEEREEYSKKLSELNSGDNHYLNKMEPEEREEFLRNKAQVVIDNGTFKGENNPMYGKVHPNKGKKYPEFSGDNHWLNKVSDEEREEVCKGRSERVIGENNPTAQVTERKVRSIKLLLRNLTHKGAIQEIAAIYGVKPRVISRIKSGETWSHVKVRGWDY